MQRPGTLLDEDGGVLTHLFVLGELVLGGLTEAELWTVDAALAAAASDVGVGFRSPSS